MRNRNIRYIETVILIASDKFALEVYMQIVIETFSINFVGL